MLKTIGFSLLYLRIISVTNRQLHLASNSSPSISNDIIFMSFTANQIKTSNNFIPLFLLSAVNLFLQFSYNAKRPNPVGLKLQTVLIHALWQNLWFFIHCSIKLMLILFPSTE
jgi:hypothetical protein